ncbi:hypothetical protein MCGE09_00424 [Thaumarchaeota archaeon SCGC AB-539-E09]|nr:hypothetical protein MCGE09_00424 [Thaumarchaeota archaeon SCGC AB-539-E09]
MHEIEHRLINVVRKIVLIFNLIVYRVDALLRNFIDSLFIISYTIIVYKLLNLPISGNALWFSLLCLPIILHASYLVTYIINDIIDYKNDNEHKSRIDYSFYNLRPIYYFNSSRLIVIYSFLIYALSIIIILWFKPDLSLFLAMFLAVSIPTAILHSVFRGFIRFATFGLLRLTKYVYLLVLFDNTIYNCVHIDVLSWVIASFVIPYTMYASISYGKFVYLPQYMLSRAREIKIIMILAMLSISFLMFITIISSGYIITDILKASISGYLLIVLPVFVVRQMLRKIFGSTNLFFHHHIARLVLGFVLMFIVAINAICILDML